MAEFVTYAQNFEDVMLWRGLQHVDRGRYIDAGASEPVAGSVTWAFYRRGWSGINLAATAGRLDALRAGRPHDVNLALDDATAAGGLAAVCARHVAGPIHFLRLDAAGGERALLDGAELVRWRPWVVLVRVADAAPLPDWEPALTASGYAFVWFDGLNRFYLAAEQHDALVACFALPPNVLDGWQLPADGPVAVAPLPASGDEQARGEAERRRQEAEHRRGEAEMIRQESERGRGEAENARQGFERTRGESELLRQSAEQDRVRQAMREHTAEWSRQQAERRRELAEAQREEAEAARRASGVAISEAALRIAAWPAEDHRQQLDELRRLLEQARALPAQTDPAAARASALERLRRAKAPPPPAAAVLARDPGRDLRARMRRVAGAEGGWGKRLFRLGVYGLVRIGARLPGGPRFGRGVHANLPRLHAWVNTRYAFYRENWLGPAVTPLVEHPLTVAELAPAAHLYSAEEMSMLARLRLQVARA